MYYQTLCHKRNNNHSGFYTLLTDLKTKSSILSNNKMYKPILTFLQIYCSMPSKKCTRPVTVPSWTRILSLTLIKCIKTPFLMAQNNSSNWLISLLSKGTQDKSLNHSSVAEHIQKYLHVQLYRRHKETLLIMKFMLFISCTQQRKNHQSNGTQ